VGRALLLWRMRTPERAVEPCERAVRADMAEGLRFVFGHPLLRPVVLCTTCFNLANAMWGAVTVLFLLRDLALPTTVAAVLLGVGSAGGAVAGLVAGRLARLGQVRLVWLSLLVTQPAWVLVPLAEPGWRVALFAVGTLITSGGVVVYNVAQVSLRQALCPDRLLGRMNASIRFLTWVRCRWARCWAARWPSGRACGARCGWRRRGWSCPSFGWSCHRCGRCGTCR
jgi:Na+/melibiose symporter-like transporter